MRRAVLLSVTLILLAGCTTSPAEVEQAPEPVAVVDVAFGCPTVGASPSVCLEPWTGAQPLEGAPTAIVPDPFDAQRIAIVAHDYLPAGMDTHPETSVVPVGRPVVAVSTDAGKSWTRHILARPLDPDAPQGSLVLAKVAWTPEGNLVAAALLVDRPAVVLAGSGVGAGYDGQAWLGFSTDEGATWTTTYRARPASFGEAAFSVSEDGHVAVFLGDTYQRSQVLTSIDGGRTWSEPRALGGCSEPHVIQGNASRLVVGCMDLGGKEPSSHVLDIALDDSDTLVYPGPSLAERCMVTGWGADPAGSMLAATSCGTMELWRSHDAGETWTRVGENATLPFPANAWAAGGGLAVDVHGVVAAMGVVGDISNGTNFGECCTTYAHLTVWLPNGTLAANDAREVPYAFGTPASWAPYAFSLNDIAAGPDRIWLLEADETPQVGWIQSSTRMQG